MACRGATCFDPPSRDRPARPGDDDVSAHTSPPSIPWPRPQGGPVAQPGINCWLRAPAHRVALLVDSAAYFEAFYEAARRARRTIAIVGWDIDSRVPLLVGRDDTGLPLTLGPFLVELVRRNRDLRVYVLGWEYPRIFASEREPDPFGGFWGNAPRRIHFHLDGTFTGMASCHQKVVVIDDALAFAGGMDLTTRRWDTPDHLEEDPRRTDPRGRPYASVHDVMAMVDGPAARALGQLARERWRCAADYRMRRAGPDSDPWPPGVTPDLTDVTVAISRTLPDPRGGRGIREVEQLYLDMIAAARRTIYIENQFFTSSIIGEALAARLEEPAGPEVVVVTSREAMSWLEEATMGVLRARLVARLRAHDRHGRLAVYDPVAAGKRDLGIKVHSKVTIVDDQLLRVGSANINNRSLGLDPECDLLVEAQDDPRIAGGIRAFRARLLGEHLDTPTAEVERVIAARGSLIAAIEALRGRDRTLEPLAQAPPEWLDEMLPGETLIDPETPLLTDNVLDELVPASPDSRWKRPVLLGATLLLLAAALTAIWRWTPLHDIVEPRRLAALIEPWGRHPAGPLLVGGGYLLTGLVGVPVNALIFATGFAFGPWLGLAYSILGFMTSAVGMYWIGVALGRRPVNRLAGPRLQRVTKRLNRHGFLAVAALRAIPVAPYVVVNLAAGAMRVRFRSYVIGTFLGMLPGTVIATLFGGSLGEFLRRPSPGRVALVLAVALVMVGLLVLLRRWLGRPRRHELPGS